MVHVFPPNVLAARVRLIERALDAAGIGAQGLMLDHIAGEVVRRDVFAGLAAMGVEFDDGCGWSLLPSGAISLTFHVVHGRDLPVIRMYVSDWAPT